jgi:hypothetical protein
MCHGAVPLQEIGAEPPAAEFGEKEEREEEEED